MESTDAIRLDHPGVVLVTGPSGSGKSQLLAAAHEHVADDPETPRTIRDDVPIIDAWPSLTPVQAVERLGTAGLSDPFTWVRTRPELSVGQRARLDLVDRLTSGPRVVVVDEFLNGLDPPTAAAVAYAVGRVTRRLGKVLIACTSVDSIANDLRPDVIVQVGWSATPVIQLPEFEAGPCSLHARVHYAPGRVADWQRVKPLHYAAGDPGTYHSVHTLRLDDHPDPIAVCVMSYPTLASAARNVATSNAYSARGSRAIAQQLNREVLLLSRMVVLPEFRCAGFGVRLIREILERTTARWVECSTAMGRYSRFLTNAGFREVPQASGPAEAALYAWASLRRVPAHVSLDADALAAWVDSLSVRHRRESRRVIWRYYFQFVVHRRTNAPPAKKVPPHHSKHWPDAYALASRRLTDRPSYWIIGPLTGTDQPAPDPTSAGVKTA